MIDFTGRHLYLCTPIRDDLEEFLASCITGGVDIVQLRQKESEAKHILEAARRARSVCNDLGVPFIMNDRPDLALEVGADGVHVGQDDAPLISAVDSWGQTRSSDSPPMPLQNSTRRSMRTSRISRPVQLKQRQQSQGGLELDLLTSKKHSENHLSRFLSPGVSLLSRFSISGQLEFDTSSWFERSRRPRTPRRWRPHFGALSNTSSLIKLELAIKPSKERCKHSRISSKPVSCTLNNP